MVLRSLIYGLIIVILGCSMHDEGLLRGMTSLDEVDSGFSETHTRWDAYFECVTEAAWQLPKNERNALRNHLIAGVSGNTGIEPRDLPNSFRSFYQSRRRQFEAESLVFLGSMYFLRAEHIGLYRDVSPQDYEIWINAFKGQDLDVSDEEYFVYGFDPSSQTAQDSSNFRLKYLAEAVQVGGLGNGMQLLLVPAQKTSDGEWEAWLFSSSSGATRFPSFAELMQHVAFFMVKDPDMFLPYSRSEALSSCGSKIRTRLNQEN